MPTAYERHLLAFYLANAASGLHHRDREASALAEWVADRENRVAHGRRSKRSRLRGMELSPDEGTLTPGDFAVVRRKAQILGRVREPDALVAMLHAECDAKPNRPRAIGFRPQAP